MPFERRYSQEMMTMIYTIHWDRGGGTASLDRALTDFDLAVTDIHNLLKGGDKTYFYAFAFVPVDHSGDFIPPLHNVEFFSALLTAEELFLKLDQCFERCIEVIRFANENTIFETLSEDEETQLAEAMISALAVGNLRFVPIYIRFLEAWDFDHGVLYEEVIPEIIEAHGECTETQPLIEISENLGL